MKTLARKVSSWIKQHRIASCFLILLIIVLCGWAWITYTPKPLGDKMEYIGKTGNYICLATLWCDSGPDSTYYYATNMTIEEVAIYFKNARLNNPSQIEERKKIGDSSPRINLTNKETNESFTFEYHIEGSSVINMYHLPHSSKRHVVEVSGRYYSTAKDSL